MCQKKTNKRQAPAWAVIALAYFHRYGWIALMLICAGIRNNKLVGIMGGFMMAVAVWSFVGYKLEWRHIYCSYQEANHQEMTPNFIRWHTVKKSDAYGVPIVLLIMGTVALAAQVICDRTL